MRMTKKALRTKRRRIEELHRRLEVWSRKQKFYKEQPDSELRTQRLAFITEQTALVDRDLRRLEKKDS